MSSGVIAIDSWKLSIFERHLKQSGYAFEIIKGPTAESLFLKVTTDNTAALGGVCKAANTEAAMTGRSTK
jgi:hypothetical protein